MYLCQLVGEEVMYNVSDVSSVGSTCSFTAYGEGMTGKGISGGKGPFAGSCPPTALPLMPGLDALASWFCSLKS